MEGLPKEDELTLWVSCLLQLNMQTGELPSLWPREPLRHMLHPLSGTLHCGFLVPAPQNTVTAPSVIKHLLKIYSLGERVYQSPQLSRDDPGCGEPIQGWEKGR